MTTDLDELGTRAARAVDQGARGVAEPPSVGVLRARVQRRQRRRVSVGAAAAIAALGLVVVVVPDLPPWTPEVTDQPTGNASPTPPTPPTPSPSGTRPETEPSTPATATGWSMTLARTVAPDVFNDIHAHVSAAAQLDDRTVIVGSAQGPDASRGPGQVGPAFWLLDGAGWRRVARDQIDPGGTANGLVMTDISAADDGRLVAVGEAFFEDHEESLVWTSEDGGESWGLIDGVAWGDAAIHAVTWGSRGFVLVGGRKDVASAWWEVDDGWVEGSLEADGTLMAVAPLGEGYIATSIGGDGSDTFMTGEIAPGAALPEWEQVTDPGFATGSLITTSAGVFAAGYRPDGLHSDGAVAITTDGVEWEPFTDDGLGGPGDQFVSDVARAENGDVFAVGDVFADGVNAAPSDRRRRAAIWTHNTSGWEPLPGELLPDKSVPGPIIFGDAGEPVVLGTIRRGSGYEVVMWRGPTLGAGEEK